MTLKGKPKEGLSVARFFSKGEQEVISKRADAMLKDPELVHEHARKRIIMQMLMLSEIPFKTRGFSAARDIVAAVSKEQEIIGAALKLKDENDPEEGRDSFRPDASSDSAERTDRVELPKEQDNQADIGALLKEASELLARSGPVHGDGNLANTGRTRRRKSVQGDARQGLHSFLPRDIGE